MRFNYITITLAATVLFSAFVNAAPVDDIVETVSNVGSDITDPVINNVPVDDVIPNNSKPAHNKRDVMNRIGRRAEFGYVNATNIGPKVAPASEDEEDENEDEPEEEDENEDEPEEDENKVSAKTEQAKLSRRTAEPDEEEEDENEPNENENEPDENEADENEADENESEPDEEEPDELGDAAPNNH